MRTPPILAVLAFLLYSQIAAAIDYPGPPPGPAKAVCSEKEAILENDALAMRWTFEDGRLRPAGLSFEQPAAEISFAEPECFQLAIKKSTDLRPRMLAASGMTLAAPPSIRQIAPDPESLQLGNQFGGWELSARLVSTELHVEVLWRAVLRDGANYIRQRVEIHTKREPVELSELVLLEFVVPRAEVAGIVDGSPAVANGLFVAVEHPMSKNEVTTTAGNAALVRCRYPHGTIVEPERPVSFGSVIGAVPGSKQARRAFLHYLERERPVPYRTFLHDNCASQVGGRWFWKARLKGTPEEFERYVAQHEKLWLDRIDVFGRELAEKRGVVMDSFVHDHGWDDSELVWKFHKGFPEGFANARDTASKYGAGVGIWFSPWGGYFGKTRRVAAGKLQGFETIERESWPRNSQWGLSLAGTGYFNHFREACLGVVRDYDVNYFKFDGFAPSYNQPGPGPYAGETAGLLRICDDLRELKPDVFLNPSTGTWPSPFWLLWADAIWRQERDSGLLGKGSERQQWITYRDNGTYHGTVLRGNLYPIANLMLHGIIIHKMSFVKMSDTATSDVQVDQEDVLAEIRSYFASGTCMQEMHIDTSLMTDTTWDALAEAANWSRRNAEVLADSHWIGGDPARGQVYGWAAWSPNKATLALRNPGDLPVSYKRSLAGLFELPPGAPQRYVLKSPWKSDAAKPAVTLTAGKSHEFKLAPFEVVVWDCVPESE